MNCNLDGTMCSDSTSRSESTESLADSMATSKFSFEPTPHAQERMAGRGISKQEVQSAMKKGQKTDQAERGPGRVKHSNEDAGVQVVMRQRKENKPELVTAIRIRERTKEEEAQRERIREAEEAQLEELDRLKKSFSRREEERRQQEYDGHPWMGMYLDSDLKRYQAPAMTDEYPTPSNYLKWLMETLLYEVQCMKTKCSECEHDVLKFPFEPAEKSLGMQSQGYEGTWIVAPRKQLQQLDIWSPSAPETAETPETIVVPESTDGWARHLLSTEMHGMTYYFFVTNEDDTDAGKAWEAALIDAGVSQQLGHQGDQRRVREPRDISYTKRALPSAAAGKVAAGG
eukprot:SAG22_NODE_426_length_10622_cov_8.088853_2_plen_343_part_00